MKINHDVWPLVQTLIQTAAVTITLPAEWFMQHYSCSTCVYWVNVLFYATHISNYHTGWIYHNNSITVKLVTSSATRSIQSVSENLAPLWYGRVLCRRKHTEWESRGCVKHRRIKQNCGQSKFYRRSSSPKSEAIKYCQVDQRSDRQQ